MQLFEKGNVRKLQSVKKTPKMFQVYQQVLKAFEDVS